MILQVLFDLGATGGVQVAFDVSTQHGFNIFHKSANLHSRLTILRLDSSSVDYSSADFVIYAIFFFLFDAMAINLFAMRFEFLSSAARAGVLVARGAGPT
jgi:hypothetical protein